MPASTVFAAAVHAAFHDGLPRALPDYEPRAPQADMAQAVAAALEGGQALLVEAPTGVGKSLAYLIPAALHAVSGGEPVIVSTYTKALEDQLLADDIPTVEAAIGRRLDVAVLRGRGNYLCLQRWQAARVAGSHPAVEDAEFRDWADSTTTGYWGDAPLGVPALHALSADVAPAVCQQCAFNARCHLFTARRRAQKAQLLIVNHALLLADLAGGGLVLPQASALIADEAHRLADVAHAAWRVTLSPATAEPLVHAFVGDGRATGTAGAIRTLTRGGARQAARANLLLRLERLTSRMERAYAALGRFEVALTETLALAGIRVGGDDPRIRLRPAGAGRMIAGPADRTQTFTFPEDEAAEALSEVRAVGDDLVELTDGVEDVLAGHPDLDAVRVELATALDGWGRLASAAKGTLDNLLDGAVRWVEWETVAESVSRGFRPDDAGALSLGLDGVTTARPLREKRAAEAAGAVLVSVPGDVARSLSSALAARFRSLVLTSATLAPGGDFAYAAEQVGLDRSEAWDRVDCTLPSPFPLATALCAVAPRDAPLPGTPDHDRALAAAVAQLRARSGRNVLVLCTSHASVRAIAARLRLTARPEGWTLLVQGDDGGARSVVERFRLARGAVLVGTASLWEGVDLPGEECEAVVIARLPFPVPTDPLLEARAEREVADGRDPFRSLHMPLALLRFVQGAGRVVRRASDRGVVLVADPRIATRPYGARFRQSLGAPVVVCADLSAAVDRAVEFLAAPPVAAVPLTQE